MEQANLRLRLGAGVIDLVGVVIFACLLKPVIEGRGKIVVHDPYEPVVSAAQGVPIGVLVWSLSFLLLALVEGVSGRSVGKRALSLVIVPRNGLRLPRARLLLRGLLKFAFASFGVALFIFSNSTWFTFSWIAALVVLVSTCVFVPRGRSPIHDLLAGTSVMRA